MKVECPRCRTHVEKPLQGDPVCPTCGYGAPAGGTAAGAGSQPPPPDGATPAGLSGATWERTEGPAAAPKQGLAIASLVLGILGCCTFFFLFGIGGIVFGAIALKKIKEEPQTYGGHGMALTGLILGIIGTIVGLVFLVFYAAIFAAVLDCEANPESDFCKQLEEEGGSPLEPVRPATDPVWNLAPLAAVPWLQRRPWHAG